MEEKLKMIKELVNSIMIPEKEIFKSDSGYTWEVWKHGYSKARFQRQITEARALLLDLMKGL